MGSDAPIKLRIPRQDLETFSLFPLDAHAARSWARGLPVTNTHTAVSQLRHALSDLNRTRVAPEVAGPFEHEERHPAIHRIVIHQEDAPPRGWGCRVGRLVLRARIGHLTGNGIDGRSDAFDGVGLRVSDPHGGRG